MMPKNLRMETEAVDVDGKADVARRTKYHLDMCATLNATLHVSRLRSGADAGIWACGLAIKTPHHVDMQGQFATGQHGQ